MIDREWERRSINRSFRCLVDGRSALISIYDLSSGGCRGRMINAAIRANASVQLDLAGFATANAHVVWQSEGNVGLRFDPPIHDAIVRYFGFEPSQEKNDDIEPRDQFGRRLTLPEPR